ncbi:hypothetical protein [Azovibrio restrictus]|uniref:hypothetical protein n=1 Tax=Azovibrio restrictus TaxID=146938 RepID=UPI0026F0A125|nr:hypothetical protein [Azovibrio restrictus]MDD3481818.1 hypothetical protein [Azovibrio restrictus]
MKPWEKDWAAQGASAEGNTTPAPKKPWEKTWNGGAADGQQAQQAVSRAPEQPKQDGGASSLGARAVSALQGPALGWYDEAVGATGALVEGIGNLTPWGTGRSMSEAYQKHRDDTRSMIAGHEKANPVMTQVDRAAAAVPLAMFGPASTASRAIAGSGGIMSQAVRTGAGAGVVAGAGDSQAHDAGGVVKDMAAGAAGGAVMGPVVAGSISAASIAAKGLTRAAAKAAEGTGFAGVVSRLGITHVADQGARNQAAQKIAQAIERDAGGLGGLTNPLEIIAARQGKLGSEATIADSGGQNTRQLLDTLATLPGKTKDVAERLIHDRQAGRAGRLIDAAESGLGTNGARLPQTLEALDEARKQAAGPLYDRVRQTTLIVDPVLESILERSSNAFGIAKHLAKINGQKFTLDEAAPGLNTLLNSRQQKAVPLSQLDTLKRSLFDMEQAHINPETGRLSELGNAYKDLRRELVAKIDTLTADQNGFSFYKAARDAYAGPTELRAAANLGSQAMSKDAWRISQMTDGMSASELEAFKIGAFESLRKKLGTEGGQTQILKMWKEPATAEKLRELFGDQKSFRQFASDVAREARLKRLESVGRGSQTASRAAGMGDLDMTGITEAGNAARNAASGNLTGLLSTAANAWNRVSTSEPVRNEMGRLLTGKGQQGAANINEIRSIVDQILEERAQRAAQAGVIAGSQQ